VYNNSTATSTVQQASATNDFTYTLIDAAGVMTALCATIAVPMIAAMF
jgi:hypothetical protein